jgi:hypothetical protein
VKVIDVSSYQPRELGPLLQETGAGAAIIHCYLPFEHPGGVPSGLDHTLAQIVSTRAAGAKPFLYTFLYPDADPLATVDGATSVMWACWTPAERPRWLALDVEPYEGQYPPWATVMAAARRVIETGLVPVLYWARYVWEHYGKPGDLTWCPQWVAQYDGNPELGSTNLFGGYDILWGKQYRTDPVDLSTFSDLAIG